MKEINVAAVSASFERFLLRVFRRWRLVNLIDADDISYFLFQCLQCVAIEVILSFSKMILITFGTTR